MQSTVTLTITVVDQSDAALPKAAITLTNAATMLQRQLVAGDEGSATFSLLPPGRYVVRAEHAGFTPSEVPDVVLGNEGSVALRVQLKVEAVGETVVVTAQKREERLQDVPVPVTVLDATRLASTSQLLLRDYYATVPGFTVAPYYTAAQTLSIRGITTGGFANPTVGVTIDDVPYTGSIGQGGTAGLNVPDFDPGDLDHIEVLRGPQGTLYGSNSMGGLIKYVTKDPSPDALTGRVEMGVSSVHNGAEPGFNFRGSINVPLARTLAMRVSGFKRQDPGYIDNPVLGVDSVNEIQAQGVRMSALWKPSLKASLKVGALYQNSQLDGVHEVVVAPGLGELEQNYDAFTGRDHRTAQAYSAVLKTAVGNIDLTSITGYNTNNSDVLMDFSYGYGPIVMGLYGVTGAVFGGPGWASKLTQEVRLSSSLGQRRIDWSFGAFYTRETGEGDSFIDAVNVSTKEVVGRPYDRPDRRVVFQEYAAFAGVTFRLHDRVELQLGGRESKHDLAYKSPPPTSESEDTVFTYLVTPRIILGPDRMLYARFASGYRPGGPNPSIAVDAGAPTQSSPDTTQTYEVGFKGELLGHKLSIDASLYHIDWKDMQLTLAEPKTRVIYATNGSSAKSEGVELSVSAKPLTGLAITGWVSYNNAVLTQSFPVDSSAFGVGGDRLPYTPRYSGYVSVEQEFPLPQHLAGYAGVSVSRVGERFGLFTPTSARQAYPDYAKTDLRAGVRSGVWTLGVYANNITDERAFIGGGVGYFYPAARIYITPRTVGMTLSRAF